MDIIKKYLTNNQCYKVGKELVPKGIMIHSTAVKGTMANAFTKSWNVNKPNGKQVCVHGFLDNTGFYQTLPFNMRGWHCAGNGNNELIGFEICEPNDYTDKEYFETTKEYAIQICIYLIKTYNLSANDITCHCEAYATKGKKYASNHSDIYHWWKQYFNYTMEDFRKEVKSRLDIEEKPKLEGVDEMRYKTVEEMPEYYQKDIQELVDKGIIAGRGGELGLDMSDDMCRMAIYAKKIFERGE